MCGIVGFTGAAQAAPILLDGLAKLEYRGYDSAGMAVQNAAGKIEVVKAKGRLKVLSEMTDGGSAVPGSCGIGHTRWRPMASRPSSTHTRIIPVTRRLPSYTTESLKTIRRSRSVCSTRASASSPRPTPRSLPSCLTTITWASPQATHWTPSPA